MSRAPSPRTVQTLPSTRARSTAGRTLCAERRVHHDPPERRSDHRAGPDQQQQFAVRSGYQRRRFPRRRFHQPFLRRNAERRRIVHHRRSVTVRWREHCVCRFRRLARPDRSGSAADRNVEEQRAGGPHNQCRSVAVRFRQHGRRDSDHSRIVHKYRRDRHDQLRKRHDRRQELPQYGRRYGESERPRFFACGNGLFQQRGQQPPARWATLSMSIPRVHLARLHQRRNISGGARQQRECTRRKNSPTSAAVAF